jgi:hypothetical protein
LRVLSLPASGQRFRVSGVSQDDQLRRRGCACASNSSTCRMRRSRNCVRLRLDSPASYEPETKEERIGPYGLRRKGRVCACVDSKLRL